MLVIIILAIGFIAPLLIGVAIDIFGHSDGFGWKMASIPWAFAFFVALIAAINVNVTKDGCIAANTERYNSLVYQYENNLYENDNDVGKKELMKEIQSWNEDLAKGKAMKDNKWVGIYYPDEVFDGFNFIKID